MAKLTKPAVAFVHKCAGCGQSLPLNEKGVPVTSIYLNTGWLCPACKFNPEMRNKLS